MSEVPVRRTPWTTQGLLEAYADAWRALIGSEPSRACLALLWAQASLECARGGASCYGNNTGNIMAFASWTGDFHVLRGAPECGTPGLLPPGAKQIDPATTSIKCAPGKVPYIPAGGSRFRAYPTLLDGCADKIRVLMRQWPRSIEALKGATGPESAHAFVEGLSGYFTASRTAYARTLESLAIECVRRTGESEWPSPHGGSSPDATAIAAPIDGIPTRRDTPAAIAAVRVPIADYSVSSPATPLRAGEGEHTIPTEEPDL